MWSLLRRLGDVSMVTLKRTLGGDFMVNLTKRLWDV